MVKEKFIALSCLLVPAALRLKMSPIPGSGVLALPIILIYRQLGAGFWAEVLRTFPLLTLHQPC